LQLPANAQQLTRDSLQCWTDDKGWIENEVILAYFKEIVLAHRRHETLFITPENFVYKHHKLATIINIRTPWIVFTRNVTTTSVSTRNTTSTSCTHQICNHHGCPHGKCYYRQCYHHKCYHHLKVSCCYTLAMGSILAVLEGRNPFTKSS
jgi:hypothetical protein